MRSFDIRPYVGASPVVFGMSRDEVHAILGAPQVETPPNQWSGLRDSWDGGGIQVGYDGKNKVDHLGFCPGEFSLSLVGSPLWSATDHPDPNPSFLRMDPGPLETLGVLVFDRIGVATGGYHVDDENDLAVTVYPRGAWDTFLREAQVPDLGRYTRVT
ncbi:MAG: hypothetical protein U0835_02080 [Isosphaeraceae bacterium]